MVTLSTGIVTLTITFVDKFRPPLGGAVAAAAPAASAPLVAPTPLIVAWLLFFVAIACALFTQMGIIGALNEHDRDPATTASAASPNITRPAIAMCLAFAGAMAAVIYAGTYLFR